MRGMQGIGAVPNLKVNATTSEMVLGVWGPTNIVGIPSPALRQPHKRHIDKDVQAIELNVNCNSQLVQGCRQDTRAPKSANCHLGEFVCHQLQPLVFDDRKDCRSNNKQIILLDIKLTKPKDLLNHGPWVRDFKSPPASFKEKKKFFRAPIYVCAMHTIDL